MNKKLAIASLLTLAGIAAAGIALANAPEDGREYDYVYYSNNSYTTAVGGRRVGCGLDQSWGVRTSYVVLTRGICGY